ncbi:hypothetical protein WDZ17_13345 [Pseudokineococcus basanitobsidens]|uniref:Autophagy-related protein 2 n=1 Tax=Pseudokineococcus basanitobsidens TaxID=1926649 RepID=A0ABU8RMU9_9ACTN
MSTPSGDTPDPIQPTVPTPKDREEHAKSPDLDEEALDHRTEREEESVRQDAGGGDHGPKTFDRDAVPNAEE